MVEQAVRQEVWFARKEAHLRLARFSEGLRHAQVELGKTDLVCLEHIQVLHYRINAVIISLSLAPRPSALKNARRALGRLEDGDFQQGRLRQTERMVAYSKALISWIRWLRNCCG